MEQVTYGALKKLSTRKEMQEEDILSLGTKAGNYGMFTEEVRVLTIRGANKIKSELSSLCKDEGLDLDLLLEFSPVLAGLIK